MRDFQKDIKMLELEAWERRQKKILKLGLEKASGRGQSWELSSQRLEAIQFTLQELPESQEFVVVGISGSKGREEEERSYKKKDCWRFCLKTKQVLQT